MKYIVYGGEGCPACKQAVNELESRSKDYQYYDVYTDMEALEFLTTKGLRGIPQIFTDSGEHIGGFKDLTAHLAAS